LISFSRRSFKDSVNRVDQIGMNGQICDWLAALSGSLAS
jgi:hypothetical protein